jgi:hypothetical protein
MAHKTFSQEQYRFRVYSLLVTFEGKQTRQLQPAGVNASLFLVATLSASDTSLGTNLFSLSRMRASFPTADPAYLSVR